MRISKALIRFIIMAVILAMVPALPADADEKEGSQVIDGIDYGNLTLQDALRRLVDIDPEIKIKALMLEQADLEIKVRKLNVWLPRIKISGSVVEPVNIFSDLSQDNGPFFGQQVSAEFSLDTNSLSRIDKGKKYREIALAEIKETTVNKARELVEVYCDLYVAQKGHEFTAKIESDIAGLLNKMDRDVSYNDLDKTAVRNYLGLLSEKKIWAMNRANNTRRRLKQLLGLTDYRHLDIKVADLPEDSGVINNYLEGIELTKGAEIISTTGLPGEVNIFKDVTATSRLKPWEYSADVIKAKYDYVKASEKISLNPILKLTGSPAAGIVEARDGEVQWKGISILQVTLFITDFGQTSGTKKADRLRTEIARLEVLKTERDLTYLDLVRKASIVELNKKIENSRDYIKKTEEVLDVLGERITLPVDTLLKINDQLLEARYGLKQMLANYLITLSRMTGQELKTETINPVYQNLTLDDLFSRAEKGDNLVESEIAKDDIKIGEAMLRVAKAGYMPKLTAAIRIEEDNIDGFPQKTTKANVSLEGKFFDRRVKYAIEEAKAQLVKSKMQFQVFENERHNVLISSYLRALRIKRTISGLLEIKSIKNDIINEITEGMKEEVRKHVEAEVLPLILQQMELERTVAGLEFSLALAEYNIKKLSSIPINEVISLKQPGSMGAEEGLKDFMDMIRTKIVPRYDPEASLKAVKSSIDRTKAAEDKETAFEGISWRLKGETTGADYDGWKDPDTVVVFSMSLPWGDHGEKIKKAVAARKRLHAQLAYARAEKGQATEMQITETRYESSLAVLDVLKRKEMNMESQLKVTEELFNMGARTNNQLRAARLEVAIAKLTYDETYLDTLYTTARQILMTKDEKQIYGGEKITLAGLQEAIEMALANSKEIKVYNDTLEFEKEALSYYKKFRASGSAGKDVPRVDTDDSDKDTTPQTAFATASVDMNLINDFMLEEQKKRIKLAEMDLERAKFNIALEVVQAYIDYLNSVAEYSATMEEYTKEKAIFDSMAELLSVGTITRSDYLKQEESVETMFQKATAINEFCELFRKNLAIYVGGLDPRFSIINLEIYDEKKHAILPLGPGAVKERLAAEVEKAEKALAGPLYDELLRRGELQTGMAGLKSKQAAAYIKSIAVTAGYTYLVEYLGNKAQGETTYSQSDALGLTLMSDKISKKLTEFFTLNSSVKIYDPTTATEARISAIDEKIAALNTQGELNQEILRVQQMFDEYGLAVDNFENLSETTQRSEEEAIRDLENAKDTGKLTITGQIDVKQNLLNNSIKRIEAFTRMMRLKNELDQYMRRYTGKGLDDFLSYNNSEQDAR